MSSIINVKPETTLISTELNKIDETKKSPGLCTRLAYGIANRVKGFGLGVAAAGIITPVSTGVTYLSQMAGLIPEMTRENNIREVVVNYQKMGFSGMNADRLLNATCYLEEFSQQLNLHSVLTPFGVQKLNTSPESIKGGLVGTVTGAAIGEEILFRGLIQDVCLTRIPKYVIKKISPGKEALLDTTIAKAARILITAAAFSAYHLGNKGVLSDAYVSTQLVATFMMGIGFGLLKESQAGLTGSVAAHITNNLVAVIPTLQSC